MGRYFSEKNLLEMDPNSSKQDIKEGLAVPDNGKGDIRRTTQVRAEEYARNWCATFGHKRWDYARLVCLDCGTTYETIRKQQILDSTT